MKKEYIPILVEVGEKKEIWNIDVTNLSVTQLIQLRETINNYNPYYKTIQALDGIIKRDIETTIPSHHMSKDSYIRTHKKNKKEEKQRRRTKKRRR